MKKIFSFLLALCLMFTMTVSVGTSAASADDAEAASVSESPAGSYKLAVLDCASGNSLAIVSSIVELGADCYLILQEDGTGCMDFLGSKIPAEWDGEGIRLLPEKAGGLPDPVLLPYTVEDGRLEISTAAYSLAFDALTESERKDYEANGSATPAGLAGRVVQNLVSRIDGALISGLLFDLMLGAMNNEPEPIPEGKPTGGTVSGKVYCMEFTVLGAESLCLDGKDYFVLFFDAANRSDDLQAVWTYDVEAAQGGEFLEPSWDLDSIVPEHFNVNFDLWPGRSIRCAVVFEYDPDGGVVGVRFSSYKDDKTVLYYADPQQLSGAPEEPFAFDADPSIPPELEELPQKTEHVSIESVEYFKDEDGCDALRFTYRFLGDAVDNHYVELFQDGVETAFVRSSAVSAEDLDVEEIEDDPECLRDFSGRLRTGSPAVFVVFEEGEDGKRTPEAAMIVAAP